MVYSSLIPIFEPRDYQCADRLIIILMCRLIWCVLDCRLLVIILPYKSMTARDTGLSGSYNCSDNSSSQPLVEQQNPNKSNTTMSATTVYPNPYYPSASAFNHNPPPNVYRKPSQPGLPICSNQCTPVPSATSFGVSDQHSNSESSSRSNAGPPLPPSSSAYNSGIAQAPALRTNTNTPVTQTPSHPHPRISSLSNPPTPIDPVIHLDIVLHPVGELVTMLASKLQNLITTNDRLKRSSTSSSRGTAFPSPTKTTTTTSTKSDSRLLAFHARNIPSITITAYLNRILKYCPTDPEVFISVLVYFDRILRIANHQAQPIFGSYFTSYNVFPATPLVSSPLPGPTHDDESFTIDSFNVHRLVITTIAVATKFFSDQFYTNSRYARVSFSSKQQS
jgi:hypothetical protein